MNLTEREIHTPTAKHSRICPTCRSSDTTQKGPENLQSLLGKLLRLLLPNSKSRVRAPRTMDIPVSRAKDAPAPGTRAPAKGVATKALQTPTPGSYATGGKRGTEPVGLQVVSNDQRHTRLSCGSKPTDKQMQSVSPQHCSIRPWQDMIMVLPSPVLYSMERSSSFYMCVVEATMRAHDKQRAASRVTPVPHRVTHAGNNPLFRHTKEQLHRRVSKTKKRRSEHGLSHSPATTRAVTAVREFILAEFDTNKVVPGRENEED